MKWLVGTIALVLIACATSFAVHFKAPPLSIQATTTTSSASTAGAKTTPTIKESFSAETYFQHGRLPLNMPIPGMTTTLRLDESNTDQARNPTVTAYIGTQGVSWVPKMQGPFGYGPYQILFSLDGHYVVFRTQQGQGAYDTKSAVNIIDVQHGQMFEIPALHTIDNYPLDRSVYEGLMTVYDYSWNSDDTLNVTFFYVGTARKEKDSNPVADYRISPKELWRYEPAAKKYTFLQTLPE